MELQAQAIKAGSSPHSRGARGHDLRVVVGRGIIPAFAGSTPRHWRSVMPSEDHPRIRGEHLAIDKWADPSLGSSPHSRGARRFVELGVLHQGIIPAFAGSTSATPTARSWTGDHPRIRGEHYEGEIEAGESEGSSPHSRGALTSDAPARADWRIIPAFAGSTS